MSEKKIPRENNNSSLFLNPIEQHASIDLILQLISNNIPAEEIIKDWSMGNVDEINSITWQNTTFWVKTGINYKQVSIALLIERIDPEESELSRMYNFAENFEEVRNLNPKWSNQEVLKQTLLYLLKKIKVEEVQRP